ncbi:hypothetical protein [Moraxella sp. ZY210820]|uniref:hypothetical protein n=1 Tax=unclassified Moraxella TaxID=2685852 RepID=UPI0027303C27|nr:hypothetical protein [Moraxella sp. ZY210820]WLF84507.1 hypothetical protein LU301_03255 [Moraxella sp. ZY210820]
MKTELEKAIFRKRCPYHQKRRLFINSRKLFKLLSLNLSYDEFASMIYFSNLRTNVDYHYSPTHGCYNLSISAVQAILVIVGTQKAWQLFNELSDIIQNGFSIIFKEEKSHE